MEEGGRDRGKIGGHGGGREDRGVWMRMVGKVMSGGV